MLCLVEGAIEVINSEDTSISAGVVRGKENLVLETQYEMACNLNIKGYGLSTAGQAIISPDDTEVATAANWKKTSTDIKNTAGVIFNTKT